MASVVPEGTKVFAEGLTFTDEAKKLWEHCAPTIEHGLAFLIDEYTKRCASQFVNEWMPKLKDDPLVEAIPEKIDEFIQLVCSRLDYKNYQQKAAEAAAVPVDEPKVVTPEVVPV